MRIRRRRSAFDGFPIIGSFISVCLGQNARKTLRASLYATCAVWCTALLISLERTQLAQKSPQSTSIARCK